MRFQWALFKGGRKMRRLLFIGIVITTVWFIGNPLVEKHSKKIGFDFLVSPVYAGQVLFADDFEKQDVREWRSSLGIAPYWEIKKTEGNNVLSGKGLVFKDALIDAGGDDWSDYSFRIKVKRINGTFQLGFRISQNGRYYIGFDKDKGSLYLRKNKPWGKNFDLAETDVKLEQNKWYALKIFIQGNNTKIFIDEDLKINYKDTDPLLYGCISVISLNGSEIHFDDVRIESLAH